MEIREILGRMTLDEKVALTIGENSWMTRSAEKYGIPALFMCDGPSGLRKQEQVQETDMLGINDSRPATCFPAAVTNSSTWDPDLMEEVGKAIGEEARDQRVGLVLGPGLNIKRDPRCGRNFEYYSEDPLLAGKLAAGIVRGIQSQGVSACVKHFACNSQEYNRFVSDSILDERTMREIYLRAFETAVREASPRTLMTSYPKVNGVHASNSAFLLEQVLRDEWGFDGVVVTDWGGMDDRVEGMRAGNDLTMPGGSDYMHKDVVRAVREGRLPEEAVDRCAGRILELMRKEAEVLSEKYHADYEAHHTVAVKAAEQGTVLLKNDGGLLPFSRDRKTAVIGWMAKDMRIQGSGSSHVNAVKTVQPMDLLPDCAYAQGCFEDGSVTAELLEEVRKTASEADQVVVFAGLPNRYESEGFDRDDLLMPEGHIRMIEAAAEANPDTAVVLICGAPVECPWADKVKAVLYPGLPGQGGAEAVVRLLFGEAVPSGKLAETWPLRYSDCVTSAYYPMRDAEYREGVYVGYRWYDAAGIDVRWAFGHGLSYTSFRCSDLKTDGRKVSVIVTNTGSRTGKETVQLYVEPAGERGYRPVRELRHFSKIELAPDESKTVSFTLEDRDFSVYDGGWKVIGGTYNIRVGASSRDLPLSCTVEVQGEKMPHTLPEGSWYLEPTGTPSREEWETMLGHRVNPAQKHVRGQFTMEDSVEDMRGSSLVMKILYRVMENELSKRYGDKKDYSDPVFRMMMESTARGPLRSMQINGGLRDGILQGMVDMANGHPIKGIIRMIRG